jgi:hypothetical protein
MAVKGKSKQPNLLVIIVDSQRAGCGVRIPLVSSCSK